MHIYASQQHGLLCSCRLCRLALIPPSVQVCFGVCQLLSAENAPPCLGEACWIKGANVQAGRLSVGHKLCHNLASGRPVQDAPTGVACSARLKSVLLLPTASRPAQTTHGGGGTTVDNTHHALCIPSATATAAHARTEISFKALPENNVHSAVGHSQGQIGSGGQK